MPHARPALLEVARITVAAARAARDLSYVRRPAGLSSIEAAITADGQGEFWLRLRQDGLALAWPLPELESGARACFPAACYQVGVSGGRLTAQPEAGQEGRAVFALSELAARVFSAAPHARLSDSVDYAAVAEPGPRPAESAVFWHKDLTGAVWLAYRTPAELAKTTWLVVIDGVYFGVRRDGADLVFERKAGTAAGFAGPSSSFKQRRLPGT